VSSETETETEAAGTVVVVGAGPGIGASVADRFARAGYAVGLVARNAGRLEKLAWELHERTGARVETTTADATDPDAVRAALGALGGELGEPAALCFSPIPDLALIRPVLETRPEELMASLALNIGGAAAAVEAVLPSMLARGRGSLLFTTGSAALHPDPARAASAVTTTAATAYVALLREALADSGVRVGHTVIVGPIDRDRDDAHHPDAVADDIWGHHVGQAPAFPTVLRLP
jgi:short-subunit dehydrogenase